MGAAMGCGSSTPTTVSHRTPRDQLIAVERAMGGMVNVSAKGEPPQLRRLETVDGVTVGAELDAAQLTAVSHARHRMALTVGSDGKQSLRHLESVVDLNPDGSLRATTVPLE